MFKRLSVATLLAITVASTAFAANNSGYGTVVELKAWTESGKHFDVRMNPGNEVKHSCGGTGYDYRLTKSQPEVFRLLTAAYLAGKGVRLAYNCSNDQYGYITGVRVRN